MNREQLAQAYLSRLDANPHELAAIFALEALFAQQGQWDVCVQTLFAHAEATTSDLTRARLLLETGRIVMLHQGDTQLAAELVQRAFALGQQDALSNEVRIFAFVLEQDWEGLEQFFAQTESTLAAQPAARARLYLRLGNVLEDSLEDTEQAAQMYRYALDLDPAHEAPLLCLQKLARATKNWSELVNLLLQELNLIEFPARQLELMLQLGELYLSVFEQRDEALQCFQNVYEYDPQNARALAGFEALGVNVTDAESDAEVLEVESEALLEVESIAQDDAPAPDVVEDDDDDELELEELSSASAAADSAASLEQEAVADEPALQEPQVIEEISEAGEAGEVSDADSEVELEEIHAESQDPSQADPIAEVSEAAEEIVEEIEEEIEEAEPEAQSWQARVAELLANASASGDAQAQRALIARAARKEWVNREQDASMTLKVWETAIAAGQGLHLFEQHHFRYEGADTWRQIFAMASGHDSLAANIALFKLQDADAAKPHIEASGDAELAQLLEDLGPGQEDWRKFQRVVEGRYPDMDRDERNVVVYTYLSKLGEALGDGEKSFDMLRRLDRMTEDLSIKGQLQVAYRDQEKWPAFVDLLKQEAAGLPDDAKEDKVDLWRASIRIYTEQMRNDMQAINLYKEILDLDADNLEAINDLIALYEKNNRTSEQITMLQQKSELLHSKKAKIEILSEIATLYLEKFRNQAEAIKTYEEILALDPFHDDAITFLKEMYEKRREWEKLIELHQTELSRVKDPAARFELFKETALIASDKLRKPEVAVGLWERALEESPQNMEILDALESLHEKAREHEPLANILERKVTLLTNPAEQMKIYQKLGVLFSNHIQDPDRAINAWQGALALEPDDRKARLSLENLYVDNQRWDALEQFYGQAEAWSDLVRTLETLVNKQQDDAVKVELLLRAARISRAQLDDIQRAERSLDRIHQQFDPKHEGAARELEIIYVQTEQHDKLQGVYAIILDHLSDLEQRRQYQLKLAQLAESQFEDFDVAVSWRARIFEEDITREQDAIELERVASHADAWPLVVEVYKRALASSQLTPELEPQLQMRQGMVLASQLNAFDQAQAIFEHILAQDPAHDGALAGMEQIFRAQSRWDDLLGVYQRRMELVDEPSKRVQILHGMAQLAEEQAQNIDVALEKYLQAYELDPEFEPTLEQLHRLYNQQGRFEPLADIIRQEIALVRARGLKRSSDVASGVIDASTLVPPSDALDESSSSDAEDGLGEESSSEDMNEGVGLGEMSSSDVEDAAAAGRPVFTDDEIERLSTLYYELGAITMQHLDLPEEAVSAFGQVLKMRPNHSLAAESLEIMLEHTQDTKLRPRIASLLAEVYELQGRWPQLIEALQIQAQAPGATTEAKIALYERVGQVYMEELADPQPAFEHYASALKLGVDNDRARANLMRLADALNDWPALIALYVSLLSSAEAESSELYLSYQFTLARIYSERTQEFARAEDVYLAILNQHPQQATALDELEDLYTRTEQWRSILDVYKHKQALAEGPEQVEALKFKAASTWENLLDDPAQAILVYQDVLAHNAHSAESIAQLTRLYRQQSMWAELAELIKHELSISPQDQQHMVKHRLGEVYEINLEQPEQAVDLYEEILTAHPLHDDAMYSLERVMEGESASALRASLILEPLYTQTEDDERLIRALYVQVRHEQDPATRIALLHRIAALSEHKLDDAKGAFDAFGLSLKDDPEHATTLSALERLAQQTLDYAALANIYEEAAAAQDEPQQRRDMLRFAAATYVNHLSDVDATTARLHEAIEAMPEDLESIDDLLNIYQHTEQWPKYGQVLTRKAQIVPAGGDKKELLLQASTVYREFITAPEDAVEVNRQLLEVFPSDMDALSNLESLYTQLERWHDLLDVFQIRLELTDDAQTQKELLSVIAAIHKLQLEQPQDAIDHYVRVLDIDPDDVKTLIELDELYESTEQWDELLGVLDRQIALSTQNDERLNLQHRTGQVLQNHREDLHGAIDTYRAILSVDPDHAPTTQALEGIIAQHPDFAIDAAQVLLPIYENLERWDELIHIYRLRVEHAQDPDERQTFLREIASIQEGCQEDRAAAFQTYAEALSLDASREDSLEKLTQLAGALFAWDPYIDTLDAILEQQDDPEIVARLQRSIAAVYATQINDAGAAIDRYVRVLEQDPQDEIALRELDQLYQAQGQWSQLAEILTARIEQSNDPIEQIELRLRLGTLYRAMLDEPEQALSAFRIVLEQEPGNELAIEALETMFMDGQVVQPIAEILEPHYLNRGEHESLINLYRQRLDHLDDAQERYDVLRQIARIYAQELSDDANALVYLGEALVVLPGERELMDELDALAERQEAWGELTGYYVRALERQDLPEATSLSMWLHLAQMIDDKLGSPESAEVAYANTLVFDPGEPTALAALDRIFEQQQRWEELDGILDRRIAETTDEVDLVDLQGRRGMLNKDVLFNRELAISCFVEVTKREPEQLEALKALEELYAATGDFSSLYEVLRIQSELTYDGQEQAQLFMRMSQLCEDNLGRRDEAIALLSRVIEIQPDDVEALMQLRRLYLFEERWEDLVTIIEMEIDLTEEQEEKLGLYENLGVIWRDRIQDEHRAHDAWQNALTLDPNYLPALEALRDIYAVRGDYVELSAVLDRMLEHPSLEQERKLELWIEQADTLGTVLMEHGRAIVAWQNVMLLNPGDRRAIDNLEILYDQEERWEELISVLEVKADNTEDPQDRLEILRKLASRCAERLDDAPRSAQYHEQILEITGYDEDSYTALEQIYQDVNSEDSLNALIHMYLDRSTQVADEPEQRTAILRRAALLFEQHLNALPNALVVLISALTQETAGDEELIAEIERVAVASHDAGQPAWAEVVNHYAQILQQVQEGPEAFLLHARIGFILADYLEQPDDAVYYLQRALQFNSESPEVLARLEDLYRQLASWPELVQTMRARIELTEDIDERVSLWREVGSLYEGQLLEVDQAVYAYEQILAQDEADLLAIESLERIYQAYERWEELIDILRQKARFSFDPDQLVAIRHQIARIYEQDLEQPERAIGAYNEVLEADQTDMTALAALENIHRNMGSWIDVLDVYKRQLDAVSDVDTQVFIYSKIATDQEEQFQNLDEAVNAYNQILALDPTNEMAVESLERLYYTTERWFDLVDIVEAHIQMSSTIPQKTRLLNELGRVQRDQVKDPHAAIEALVRSLEVDPNQEETLQELALLYEATQNWEAAIETYAKRIGIVYDAATRVELCYRVAEIYETQLMDDGYAEQSYREGLKLDSGHRPTLEALRSLYERQANWQGVIETLKQAQQSTRELNEQAGFLAEIGRVYDERLDDMVSAIRYYEQAQELDPSRTDAAEPLIDVYMRERRYERALPLLRQVLDPQHMATVRDPAAKHLRLLQMAQTSEQLGLFQDALDHYHRAYEFDPTSMEGLSGLGRQLYRHEDYEAAFKIYQSLQLQHLERLNGEEARDLFYHCGMIKLRIGEQRRAVEYFENALSYDADHKETIQALLENYEATGLWDRFIQMQQALLEQEQDPKVKFTQLTRIGDIFLTKLSQESYAAQAYLQALDLEPKSVIVLRKLLDLYTKMRRWPEAIEMLERIIATEADPSRQAKLAYTIAVIYRDEVQDPNKAVEYFDRALDMDFNLLKAFEAISRIQTDNKNWKGLEHAYRFMLKRVAQHNDGSERIQSVHYMLWEGLGEIYRSRLNHMKSAIQAFEMASELNPSSEKVHRILAELYDIVQDADGSVRHHRRIIENDPFKIESYRALFKAYIHKKAYDRAWCMASALSFLQQANEIEEKYYQEYLGNNLKKAKRTFTQDTFRLLYHPEQDMLITVIMQQLNIAFSPGYARDPKELGINKKKDLLDPNGELLFSKIYSYVGTCMAPVGLMPTPLLYLRRDQAIGMRNANTLPASFIVGADMLQGKDERELAFLVSKRLGWMLSPHYLGGCGYPTEWLKAFFMAAMHVTDTSLGVDRQLGENAAQLIQALQDADRQSPGLLLQIQKLMRQFLDSGRNPNLSHWLTSVDHTTSRIGLLICGDLKKAVIGIKNDPLPIGKASIKDKIRELVLFSISDEYFTLREQLGLAIGT